jgi:hypothetical protein
MKGLQRINSIQMIDLFVELWEEMQNVQLTENPDVISWTVPNDKCYSASSAYSASYLDRIKKSRLRVVWDVRGEGKIKFFFWLLVQNRLWTADRLEARGWPHEEKCVLCDQESETTNHLILDCSFAKEIWQGLNLTHPVVAAIANRSTTIPGWWRKIARFRKSKTKRDQTSLALITIWHLWKERSRRIFENCSCPPSGLLVQIRESMANLAMALRE